MSLVSRTLMTISLALLLSPCLLHSFPDLHDLHDVHGLLALVPFLFPALSIPTQAMRLPWLLQHENSSWSEIQQPAVYLP
mmetsp:Transcript_32178/g.72281  ORF Transcript_32178/g.72281 Transcript_32178/m.72281 type:complete len:80 (-) Transcript_32178:196-435(-)